MQPDPTAESAPQAAPAAARDGGTPQGDDARDPAPANAGTLADLPGPLQEALLDPERDAPFQVLPTLAAEEYDALRASVDRRGVRVPVELDADGRVLDGHHRLRAAAELGLDPEAVPLVVRDELSEEEALEYVLELNLDRRHLTPEQRRKVAAELREHGWSLRRIGARVGVHHETIRRDLDAGVENATGEGGDGDRPETVQGRDGKRYPARRPAERRDGRPEPGSAGEPEPEEPDRDPRADLLDRADALLSEAADLTSEEEPEVLEELESLADRVNALQRRIAGTGEAWEF